MGARFDTIRRKDKDMKRYCITVCDHETGAVRLIESDAMLLAASEAATEGHEKTELICGMEPEALAKMLANSENGDVLEAVTAAAAMIEADEIIDILFDEDESEDAPDGELGELGELLRKALRRCEGMGLI